MKSTGKIRLSASLFFIVLFSAVPCSAGEKDGLFSRVTVEEFYNYDKKAPLNAEEEKVKETDDYIRYHITYNSVHDKKVTAVLTVYA